MALLCVLPGAEIRVVERDGGSLVRELTDSWSKDRHFTRTLGLEESNDSYVYHVKVVTEMTLSTRNGGSIRGRLWEGLI